MGRFIDFLFANPLIAILLIGWLFGGIGKMLKGNAEAKQRRQRRERAEPDRQPDAGSRAWPTGQQQRQRTLQQSPVQEPVRRQLEQTSSPTSRPAGKPSADDVAAEMRRILGMDAPKAKPQQSTSSRQPTGNARSSQQLQPQALSQPMPSQAAQPIPLVPDAQTKTRRAVGDFQTQVDPHVGEKMQARGGPSSGRVGMNQLGGLGGRSAGVRKPTRRKASRFVDLRDMAKVFVLKEVFDKPVGMRDMD